MARQKLIIASSLLVVGVLSLLLWMAIQPQTASPAGIALDRKLAELQVRGEPLTAEGVARRFPDPHPDRDAQTVLQGLLTFTPRAGATTNLPVLGGPWPNRRDPIKDTIMRDLAVYLGSYKQLLEAIPDDLHGVHFSRGWTNGITNLISMPLVPMRSLFQSLSLTALYAAERQDTQTAGDAIRKGFALTETFNDELLVNAMIRAACASLMSDTAEQVLNRARLTEQQLAEIASKVALRTNDTLTNALCVERYLSVLFLSSARADQTNGSTPIFSVSSLWDWMRGDRGPVYRDEDYLLILEVTDERMSDFKLPGIERIKRNQEVDLRCQTNIYSSTARLLMPNWTKALKAHCEVEAKLVTLQVAIAIERYRLAHNLKAPDLLESLTPAYLPAAPRDPFDDQPLRYKKLTHGYVVYSIGADGVDNGGTGRTNQTVTTDYDVTFTIER